MGFLGVWKIRKSQGIKFEIRENLENLEKSGNFCLFWEFFHTLVFAPSLFLYMPSNFLGSLKIARKNVIKSRNFEKFSLEHLEKSGNFIRKDLCEPCVVFI